MDTSVPRVDSLNRNAATRYWLTDPTLSMKARGIFAYLAGNPDANSIAVLVEASADGADSVRSGVHELEVAGYLRRQRLRQDGQWGRQTYVVFPNGNAKEAF